MEKYILSSIIWKEEDIYVSKCPELDIASFGETETEARENLQEAIELFLENAKVLDTLDGVYPLLRAEKSTSLMTVEI